MPFQSDAQRRWMYATDPKMAEKWQKETPKGADLPEKVSNSSDNKIEAMKKLVDKKEG